MQKKKTPFTKKLEEKIEHIDKGILLDYLKQFESRETVLRNILSTLNDGVILLDTENRPIYVSDTAQKWLNIQASDNQSLWEIIHDEELSSFLKSELNSGNLTSEVIQSIHVLNPNEQFFRIRLIPIQDSDDFSTTIVIQDISNIAKAEWQTLQFSKMEGLIRLAGGIAHEIGNPLNTISIYLELIKKLIPEEGKSLPPETSQKLLNHIQVLKEETSRLDNIVRDFLTVTRKPALRFQMQNLSNIVEDVISFFEPEFKKHGIHCSFTHKGSSYFALDKQRIYGAIVNLVRNAMESISGEGHIDIDLVQEDQRSILTIRDTGSGMTEDIKNQIFDAYFTTKQTGSGLGLMLVFDMAQDHGAKIDVETQPGEGTVFKITFPMRRPNLQLENHPTGGNDHDRI